MIERLIAAHCAPALAGIKPANIVACKKEYCSNITKEVTKLNGELNCCGIYIDILCECSNRALMIVYRKSALAKQLSDSANRAFLKRFGYNDLNNTEEYLEILKTRLNCDSFPHEIGVFLGYPLYDIYCFMKHRDKGCLLVGEWKVYHNAEEATKIFNRFKACRTAVAKKVTDGKSLAQIFCAA